MQQKSNLSHQQRTNSGIRVQSRDQLPPFIPKRAPTPSHATKSNGPKPKAGFTLASTGDDDDDEDWISSESGAATPNHHQDSDSDPDSGPETPIEQPNVFEAPRPQVSRHQSSHSDAQGRTGAQTPLPRVDTARPSDYDSRASVPQPRPAPAASTLPPPIMQVEQNTFVQPQLHQNQYRHQQNHRFSTGPIMESHSAVTSPSSPSRPATKRQSSTRPPSMHGSMTGKLDHSSLRPHPLIRGDSYGQPNFVPKPAPLAPLTVTPEISSSPPSSIHESIHYRDPSSPRRSTSPSSPNNPYVPNFTRRTSISSARSVATLPVSSSSVTFTTREREPKSFLDRTRTLSTISSSSSSAALSSLTHIPAVSRPPTPQLISFFPPVNPHVNTEAIHPLLPVPYLSNHLTIVAHRTPIRESFDRVMRAKLGR